MRYGYLIPLALCLALFCSSLAQARCPAGSYVGTAGLCALCPPGTYNPSVGGTCQLCPVGTYTPPNSVGWSVPCQVCPAGTLAPTTGTINSCDTCPSPKRADQTTQTCQSQTCPVGTWMASAGCTPCAAGTFSNTVDTITCPTCGEGAYQPLTGQTGCLIPCPASEHPNAQHSNCVCDAGFYTTDVSSGSITCTACAAGTFSPSPASYSCQACPTGTYTSLTGATGCAYCEVGKVPNAAQTECVQCPPGTTSSTSSTGHTICTPCPAGSFSTTSGSNVCSPCGANTYSNAGSTNCPHCGPGQWSPAGAPACSFGFAHWSFDLTLADDSGTYAGNAVGTTKPAVSSALFKFGAASLKSTGSGYVALPTIPFLTAAADNSGAMVDWSVAVWVWTSDSTAYDSFLGSTSSSSGSGNYLWQWDEEQGSDVLRIVACYVNNVPLSCGGSDYDVNSQPFSPNSWHHIALTFSAATGKLVHYIDGAASGPVEIKTFFNQALTYWTIAEVDSTTAFTGYLDELWIVNRTLSSTEVRSLIEGNVL